MCKNRTIFFVKCRFVFQGGWEKVIKAAQFLLIDYSR